MTALNSKFKPFDRNPPAALAADDTPLSDTLRYMRVTDKIFRAFGWQMHPIVHTGYLRWSAPAPGNDGYVLYRTFADTSGSSAGAVNLYVSDLDDCDDAPCEMVFNDLLLFQRLAEVYRMRGIGRIDTSELVEAIQYLALSAAGYDPASMPTELFAILVEDREHEVGEPAAQSGALQ